MDYLLGGIESGVRSDGRGLLDYRACVIESDTLLHANGSAIVVLGGLGRGNTTRVLGVVKAEVGRTSSSSSTTSSSTSTTTEASALKEPKAASKEQSLSALGAEHHVKKKRRKHVFLKLLVAFSPRLLNFCVLSSFPRLVMNTVGCSKLMSWYSSTAAQSWMPLRS